MAYEKPHLIPRIRALRDKIQEVDGEEAARGAESPILFQNYTFRCGLWTKHPVAVALGRVGFAVLN
jgi:hypothetical protein